MRPLHICCVSTACLHGDCILFSLELERPSTLLALYIQRRNVLKQIVLLKIIKYYTQNHKLLPRNGPIFKYAHLNRPVATPFMKTFLLIMRYKV